MSAHSKVVAAGLGNQTHDQAFGAVPHNAKWWKRASRRRPTRQGSNSALVELRAGVAQPPPWFGASARPTAPAPHLIDGCGDRQDDKHASDEPGCTIGKQLE